MQTGSICYLKYFMNYQGEIVSLKLNNSDSIVLTKCHRILTSPNRGAITCLSWRSWISREARDPMLLANCANNILCLYKLVEFNFFEIII